MIADVELDEALVAKAKEATGVEETSAVIELALTALVQREAARRLAAMGGSDPDAWIPPRRSSEPA